MQPTTALRFSASRALRLLGLALDAVIAVGIVLILSWDIGYRAITETLCAATVLALVFCWLAFVAVHVAQLFTARRHAISGLWRALVYFLVFCCSRLLIDPGIA